MQPNSSTRNAPAVETIGLSKNFGPVQALDAVDLAIPEGAYFVLLGPSGGGKTTLLRLVGGFLRASAGRVLLHGADVTDVPPDRRPTSMVFQNYALFPHMNVERNVGYGLRIKKLSAAEIAARVDGMLDLVGLAGLNKRMPHELSGGQQQRVQLGRSLVLERDVLLLDEPLAALDAKLRKDMCLELKRIQEEVGITFVHVTHNQEEAMTVADRVALISDGRLVEEGTPRDIYERPTRRFTAGFIGENNLFDGTVAEAGGGRAEIDCGFTQLAVVLDGEALAPGQAVTVSLRSEAMTLAGENDPADDGWQQIPATLLKQVYLGLTTSFLLRLPDGREMVARAISAGDARGFSPGDKVSVRWPISAGRLHTD